MAVQQARQCEIALEARGYRTRYADDSTECATAKTMAILKEELKADIDKIVMWCDENRIATNQNLTLKSHTDTVFKTVSMVLAKFRQIKPFLPEDAQIKFSQTFMFPHLHYYNCVWGSAQLERLFKLQKRAVRMIYNLHTRTPTAPLLNQLNWMPLMDRIKYRKAVVVFKSLNGLAPNT